MSHYRVRHLRHEEIVCVLERNGIVAMATDTVYGLHGIAPATHEKLTRIKNRNPGKPLLLIFSDIEMVMAFTGIQRLPSIARLWPAPLTLVLPLKNSILNTQGISTIAVRVPDNPGICTIIKELGYPLYSTSANKSGMTPIFSPKEIFNIFLNHVELIVDDGIIQHAVPSTIVDATDSFLRVLRYGAINIPSDYLK